MVIIIKLAFPSPDLSPNKGRSHWAPHAKAVKSYKLACWADTLAQCGSKVKPLFGADDIIDVHMEFYRPHKWRFDEDGLVSRMKAGLDGIADALGVNDRNFRISQRIAKETGDYVMVTLTKALADPP